MTTESQIFSQLIKSFAPPPVLSISEWADQYRFLSPESSAEPGRWETKKAEYQREIMDMIRDDVIETVIIMSSSQVGKTEILLNADGFYMDQEPSPQMTVQPTIDMAQTYSKDRLAPMIRDCPKLKGIVKDAKARDSNNTILHKTFPGGHITISGANSPASLASRPIRILKLDEVDRYPVSAGTEGDPVNLAIKRTKNFWNRKIIATSTPTIKDISRIEKMFNDTDQRKYYIPCPHCNFKQELKFENVKWLKDDKGDHLTHTAYYECEKCKKSWSDVDRWDAIEKGEWRKTAEAKDTKSVGYHIWAAYSPWTTLQEIADEFLKAKRGGRELLKTFFNTVLGQPFEEKGLQFDHEALFSRVENYKHHIPEEVLILTCGVDIQADRIEGEIKGWGHGYECWGIEYFIIQRNPETQAAWDDLTNILLTGYEHPAGLKLRIACAFIDSGYKTDVVYNYTSKMEARNIYSTKGKGDAGRPLLSRVSQDKKHRTKAKFFIIGTNEGKDKIFYRLNKEESGPGFMHFPNRRLYDVDYFKQLTAEKAITRYKNNVPYRSWEPKTAGARNEVLDITVLNFAAIEFLNPNFDLIEQSFKSQVKKKVKTDETKRRPSSGWVNKWR